MVCERNNATVSAMLAKCVSENQRDWDEWLPHVAFCYNASVHETTKYSPFFLMHEMEPHWDADIQLGTGPSSPESHKAYAVELLFLLEGAHEITWEGLQVTAGRMQD